MSKAGICWLARTQKRPGARKQKVGAPWTAQGPMPGKQNNGGGTSKTLALHPTGTFYGATRGTSPPLHP